MELVTWMTVILPSRPLTVMESLSLAVTSPPLTAGWIRTVIAVNVSPLVLPLASMSVPTLTSAFVASAEPSLYVVDPVTVMTCVEPSRFLTVMASPSTLVTSPPACASRTLTVIAVNVSPLTVPAASTLPPTVTSDFDPVVDPSL